MAYLDTSVKKHSKEETFTKVNIVTPSMNEEIYLSSNTLINQSINQSRAIVLNLKICDS